MSVSDYDPRDVVSPALHSGLAVGRAIGETVNLSWDRVKYRTLLMKGPKDKCYKRMLRVFSDDVDFSLKIQNLDSKTEYKFKWETVYK